MRRGSLGYLFHLWSVLSWSVTARPKQNGTYSYLMPCLLPLDLFDMKHVVSHAYPLIVVPRYFKFR